MLSSTPHSVRPPYHARADTLFGTFMCEPTDGDGKQFGDLEPAIAECQGLEMEIFPLRFPQWWWDR